MSEKKCPLCGGSVDVDAKECGYCGASLVNEETKQDNAKAQGPNPQEESQGYSNPDPDPKSPFSYLPVYYQEEFATIDESHGAYKGKWNWAAFFFSWIWGFTKGLWALSLISLFLSLLFNRMHADALNLALGLIWGVRGNYFYYQLVKHNKQIPDSI
ncbi:MAG TPA: DUF2628 domain-containing protein [Clostridiaceae bacterium]